MIRIDINEKSYLQINAVHQDGYYKIYFTQYDRVGDGLVEMCPFDKGNFTVKLGMGRKSAKKLEKINDWLSSYSSILFTEWHRGEYQEVADRCFNFWHNM